MSIAGKGTIVAGQYHSVGKLTFLHGVTVGANQTLEVNGYELYGGQYGNVEIQTPSLFHAAVDIGFGQVQLDGVHGTSYSFKNDLLSIFNGKSIADTLKPDVDNSSNAFPVHLMVANLAGGTGIYN